VLEVTPERITMNVDRAYHIGDTHEECQDYAIAHENVVAISDGCSGSPLTDFGSRLLAVSAVNLLVQTDDYRGFNAEQCILTARPAAKLLNLPQNCLDATLLFVAANELCIRACAYGDGIIAVKLKDGTIFYAHMEFPSTVPGSSFPYYINYLFDRVRFGNWQSISQRQKTTIGVILPDGEHSILEDDLKMGAQWPRDYAKVGGLRDGERFLTIGGFEKQATRTILDIEDSSLVECISVMSDGIGTFYRKGGAGYDLIPAHEILPSVLGFKGYCGKFVQRRVNRFLKSSQAEGIGHADDFSIAAIYLGDDQ
jgi:hypothetical protein